MKKYNDYIDDSSLWITVTPTQTALALPFNIMEIGHFFAQKEYRVKRDFHESFLVIYTIKGSGIVKTFDTEIEIPSHQAIIIDCCKPHEYYSNNEDWEFLWLHINGSSVGALFEMIYPNGQRSINIKNTYEINNNFKELIEYSTKNDVAGSIKISSLLHSLLFLLFSSAIEDDSNVMKKGHIEDIESAVDFIRQNYSRTISVDDMVESIHISKYHFIRLFSRVMGVTPYNYLINYRINISKELLHSTSIPISEIAEQCGFMDTSNFISQFKKHTGQKPLQYRNSFTA